MIRDKVAVVTGAARGIGREIAINLAREGYALAVMDIRKGEDVKDSLEEFQALGLPFLYYQGDLSSSKDRGVFCQSVMSNFGRVDCLVNNAGVAPRERKDILEVSEEAFDYLMNINLKGTFFLTQQIAQLMIELKDKLILKELLAYQPVIINIASISSYTSSPSRGEYCISKAGVSMITKLFADRLAEYKINVYEIRPGIVKTDMTKGVEEKYNKLIAEGITPIKRWGYPEDVAKAVKVLSCGQLAFSTGQVINVDGGFHLRRL